jgi:hypothetical protein
MLSAIIIAVALVVSAYLLTSKQLSSSSSWRATVTPLASIMGSGFLVSAPLLAGIVGNLAVVSMGLLLVVAYGVGSAIRFNIRHFEPIENQLHGHVQRLAFLSRLVLAVAYFISVTYYLQLLSAFVLNALGVESELASNLITSVLLISIGVVGIWRGLERLETIEKYAVSLNLGMIAALLVGLAAYNAQLALSGEWALPAVSSSMDLHDLRVLLGLLIVVQGFETSRYLGSHHSADERITTMRRAQLISALIYLLFISLATVLFRDGLQADVTAIIEMTAPVAVALPLLISLAAVGSQFSAAVADNSGAGGLLEESTRGKLPVRYGYLLILLTTLALTWETNVNSIIAYASRAFALYYMLQCLVALAVSRDQGPQHRAPLRQLMFCLLAVICGLVFAVGLPSE